MRRAREADAPEVEPVAAAVARDHLAGGAAATNTAAPRGPTHRSRRPARPQAGGAQRVDVPVLVTTVGFVARRLRRLARARSCCHIVEGCFRGVGGGGGGGGRKSVASGAVRWICRRPRGPPTERRRCRAQTRGRRPRPLRERNPRSYAQEGQRGIRRHLHAHVRRVGGGPLVVERGHLGLNQRHVPPILSVATSLTRAALTFACLVAQLAEGSNLVGVALHISI